MLLAAVGSWGVFLLLAAPRVAGLPPEMEPLALLLGCCHCCGYIPFLVFVTVQCVVSHQHRRISGLTVVYLVLMWLPLGVSVIGSMLIGILQ